MGRNIEFATDELYHVYNRGTEKRNIFQSKSDYDRFLALLYVCNGEEVTHLQRQGRTLTDIGEIPRGPSLVDIGAYCLMPNHFHLLVREKESGGVSRFMQKLMTGYTMYFNKLNDRTGVLFQGKFKARHVDVDTYLNCLIAYIHLNPVKLLDPEWKRSGNTRSVQTQQYLEAYQYSSYLDYLGKSRIENRVIDKTCVPLYFESPEAFRRDMSDWLQIGDPED